MSKYIEMLSLKEGSSSPKQVHSSMKANLVHNTPEAIILMCAIVIASVGLNVGSTAVVIGAMLISPIMGPLQTIGYSLAIGSKEMLKDAVILLIKYIAIALVASTIYFIISPLNEPTTELLARTGPTFWDVLIAVFGGIAGIIGVTRAEKTNVIPGVAIATALMPPLATVGFGIAHLDPKFIFGAGYLFTINAIFITMASVFGIVLLGLRSSEIAKVSSDKRSRRQLQIVLLIILIPSIITSTSLINEQVISSNVDSFITSEIETESRKVVSTEINYDTKEVTLIIVGTTLTANQITNAESNLSDYNLANYQINLVQSSVRNTVTETIKSTAKTVSRFTNKTVEEASEVSSS